MKNVRNNISALLATLLLTATPFAYSDVLEKNADIIKDINVASQITTTGNVTVKSVIAWQNEDGKKCLEVKTLFGAIDSANKKLINTAANTLVSQHLSDTAKQDRALYGATNVTKDQYVILVSPTDSKQVIKNDKEFFIDTTQYDEGLDQYADKTLRKVYNAIVGQTKGFFEKCGEFISNHKGKIVAGTLTAGALIGAALYYMNDDAQSDNDQADFGTCVNPNVIDDRTMAEIHGNPFCDPQDEGQETVYENGDCQVNYLAHGTTLSSGACTADDHFNASKAHAEAYPATTQDTDATTVTPVDSDQDNTITQNPMANWDMDAHNKEINDKDYLANHTPITYNKDSKGGYFMVPFTTDSNDPIAVETNWAWNASRNPSFNSYARIVKQGDQYVPFDSNQLDGSQKGIRFANEDNPFSYQTENEHLVKPEGSDWGISNWYSHCKKYQLSLPMSERLATENGIPVVNISKDKYCELYPEDGKQCGQERPMTEEEIKNEIKDELFGNGYFRSFVDLAEQYAI